MSKEKEKKIFSNELINILNNKKDERQSDMKCHIDGEPKNVNPLTDIPESQMRLYGFSGIFKSAFFDTEEELIEYVKNTKLGYGSVCIMDFLGNVAGCHDVIRLTYQSGKEVLYTVVNEYGYGKYNPERSFYKGEFVWEHNDGQIREMYSPFRDRGIVFEDDIYAKIDERYKQLMDMCKERTIIAGKRKKASDENAEPIEKQKFDVLAVPCDKPFVVSAEKAEEFKNLRNSPEERAFVKKCADKLRINNLVEEGQVLKKVKKLENK